MTEPERPKEAKSWRFVRGRRFRRRRLTSIAILPTLITLGNLVCGCLSLLYTARGFAAQGSPEAYHVAAGFILLAMVFDALDGRVARLTRTASGFGAQLDSLCDLVSFGVAPAFLTYSLSLRETALLSDRLLLAASGVFIICAAVRLARFNIETDDKVSSHLTFAGLPTPASAGVVAASIVPWRSFPDFALLHSFSRLVVAALPFVLVVLAVLMISRIPYVHLLNRFLRGPRPFVLFVEVILLGILLALFHEFALFLAFSIYTISGPVVWIRSRLRRQRHPEAVPEGPSEESLF